MSFQVDAALLLGFLLAFVRAAGWVATSPPFTTNGIPAMAKIGLSAGLALGVVGRFGSHSAFVAAIPTSTGGFIAAVVVQAIAGCVLGFGTTILFSAMQVAGGFIDLSAGLNLTAAIDPLSLQQEPVIGRLFNMTAMMLLFSSGAYLLLVEGFLTSFRGLPLSGLDFASTNAVLVSEIGTMLLSALELAAPLMAVLFLTNTLLGLLSRVAPQVNILALSFGLNVLVAVLLVGVLIPLLPGATENLIQEAVRNGAGINGP